MKIWLAWYGEPYILSASETDRRGRQMYEVKLSAGEHIDAACARLEDEARTHGSARLVFNEVVLDAQIGDSADTLVAKYYKLCDERRIAWRNSDEGKAYEAEREAKIAAMQDRHDNLMSDLSSLDWSNDVAVLDWLLAMQEPTDHIGVAVDRNRIIAAFNAHGYEAGMCCGDAYKVGDRAIEHKYLVGQALSTLKACAIHGVLHSFADKWKAKFVNTSA